VDEPNGFHPDQYPEMREMDDNTRLPKKLDEITRNLMADCKVPDGVYTQIVSRLQGSLISGDPNLWLSYLSKIDQLSKTFSNVFRDIIYVSFFI